MYQQYQKLMIVIGLAVVLGAIVVGIVIAMRWNDFQTYGPSAILPTPALTNSLQNPNSGLPLAMVHSRLSDSLESSIWRVSIIKAAQMGLRSQKRANWRTACIDLLHQAGPDASSAIPALKSVTQDEDIDLRIHAYEALVAIAGDSTEIHNVIVSGLEQSHDARLSDALICLMERLRIVTESARAFARSSLASEDREFDRNASNYLAMAQDSDALPLLRFRLADSHPYIPRHVFSRAIFQIERGISSRSDAAEMLLNESVGSDIGAACIDIMDYPETIRRNRSRLLAIGTGAYDENAIWAAQTLRVVQGDDPEALDILRAVASRATDPKVAEHAKVLLPETGQ